MDQRASLPAISAPTLVIAGADDPATPPEHAHVIARSVPTARVEIIDNAAHLAPVSEPAAVTTALLSHMRGALSL
jgi:3-oxoadipate enol-lactonase